MSLSWRHLVEETVSLGSGGTLWMGLCDSQCALWMSSSVSLLEMQASAAVVHTCDSFQHSGGQGRIV